MFSKIRAFFKNSKGATAIEYALIASLVAVVAIAGMKAVGSKISNQMNAVGNSLGS